MDQFQTTSNHILALADRCVKCGLCLPQCPTYNLTSNENESPRGRIALIQGWLTGELAPSKKLTQHLDQCLLCRRCERICPSVVPYGEIMDQSKALLTENSKQHFSLQSFITNRSLKLLLNQNFSGILVSTLRVLQNIRFFTLIKKTGLFKLIGLQRLITYLPKLDKPIKTEKYYPATLTSKGNVSLFTGCLSKQLDPQTVRASIRLLNRLGYGVYVPEQQVCCGALHLHDGNISQAVKFSNTNIKTFNTQKDTTAIVSVVNGCTAQLKEYPQLETESQFAPEVKDIIEFLAEADWDKSIKFEPLNKNAAIQIPCSLQNSLKAEDKLMALIQRIPELSCKDSYNRCCGAAGSYFLRHPTLSDQLKEQAVSKLTQSTPDFIISSNLGCALQLKAGLATNGSALQVIHPIVLLEQQLSDR